MMLDVRFLHFFNWLVGTSQVFDVLIVFFSSYVQYVLVAVFLLLVYFSEYSRKQKRSILLVTMISSLIARFGITEIIRFFYHRPRPFLALPVNKLLSNGWFYSDNAGSFPSGHSAFFFAMATAIYLYNKKWGIGFFLAAILMNIGRIVAGVHYPSDILGGMMIGIVVGYVVFRATEPG